MNQVKYIAGTLMTGESFVNRLTINGNGDTVMCVEIARCANANWAADIAALLQREEDQR